MSPQSNGSRKRASDSDSDVRKRAKQGAEGEMQSQEEVEQLREEFNTQQLNRANAAAAQAGYILSVELENFLCHESCKIEFGSRINFLTGANGSGKSAILAAISLGLGGTTSAAGRGANVAATVRYGKAYAIIIIKLANRGVAAYKNDVYGDVITIERKIVAEGNGGYYKTKDVNGKTISKTKSELEHITDEFNLQVDNPLTVLTQQSSKTFLKETSPAGMYAFFLEGTQLKQLALVSQSIANQIQNMSTALELKSDLLPDLLTAYKRAKAAALSSQAAIDQKANQERLVNEVAWTHIDDIEETIDSSQNLRKADSSKLSKYKEAITLYETGSRSAHDTIKELDIGISLLNDQHLETVKAFEQAKDALKRATEEGKERRNEYRDMMDKLNGMNDSIARIEKEIETERNRLERDSGAENKIIMDQIHFLKMEKIDIDSLLKKANLDIENVENETLPVRTRFLKLKGDIEETQKKIKKEEDTIKLLLRGNEDPISVYSWDVQKLAREMRKTRDWREVPIGPIGLYVKVKETRFSNVLESFFGAHLNAFIVTNHRDKQKLIGLASSFRCKVPIFTQAYDETFDCRGGEPDQDYLTIRRALQYSNELVEQVSIVALRIEKMILLSKRSDGDVIMRFPPKNVQGCFTQDLFKVGGIIGGSSTVVMPPWEGPSRLNDDVAGQVRELEEKKKSFKETLDQFESERGRVEIALVLFTQQTKAGELEVKKLNTKMKDINRRIAKAELSIIHDEESNLDQLEESKQESAAELASLKNQIRPFTELMKHDEVILGPLKAKRIELEIKMKGLAQAMNQAEHAKTEPSNLIYQNNSNVEEYQGKINLLSTKIDKLDEEITLLNTNLTTSIEYAQAIGERPNIAEKKSRNKLEAQIEAIKKNLRDLRNKQGKSLEAIINDFALAKKVLTDAKSSIAALEALTAELSVALELRKKFWVHMTALIGIRACFTFQQCLLRRKMQGQLTFHHDRSLLSVRVLTAANSLIPGLQPQDINTLSGGERAFSTIAFLFTLWEAIDSPIRCLDEFEVGMDVVNKVQSIKMLVDGAKANPNVQFILISPLSVVGMDNVDPDLYKIVRMKDPR